MTQNT